MEKKTVGMLAFVVTILLFGIPGLCGLCFGSTFVFAGAIPGADIDIAGSSDPAMAIASGIGMLCLSLLCIAIPAVVGFIALRQKSGSASVNDPDYLSE